MGIMFNANSKFIQGTFLLLVFLLINMFLISCFNEDKISQKQPVKIILDTDMGSDCDDVGTLALLHAYADDDRAEILACIYSSGKVRYGAGIIDAINTYYERPNIPIGAYKGFDIGDSVDKMSAEKLAKDTSAFGNDIISNEDAEDQTILSRKILVAQEDNSVTYITIGHTKGIYDLLISKPDSISSLSGMELAKKKIKRWIATGGISQNKDYFNYDWNYSKNGAALYTKYVVENWPNKAYFILGGENVFLGKNLKDTPPGNIVRTAYRDWLWWWGHKTLDDQRLSGDLFSIYYAVEGLGENLTEKEYGWLEVNDSGGTKWHKDQDDTNQVLIIQRKGTDKYFEEYLGKLTARSPQKSLK